MVLKQDNKHEIVKALSPDAKIGDKVANDGSKHSHAKDVNFSTKWFTGQGAYDHRAGIKVEKLICGKAAFAAIHKAIEKAKKSVDIIIWGFDPMMRFNPDEPNNLTIGELLEKKAQQGVECRIMVWYDNIGKLGEPTLIGSNYAGAYDPDAIYQLNIDPRPEQLRLNEYLKERDELKDAIARYEQNYAQGKPRTVSDISQYERNKKKLAQIEEKIAKQEKDMQGYGSGSGGQGGPSHLPEDQRKAFDWIDRVSRRKVANLQLKTRNFTLTENNRIYDTLAANIDETNVNFKMKATMGYIPSHHQKLVVIDYEIPESETCTGFVMGHNMHRNYWDTPEHYYYDEDANRVQGFGPWQDISMQVWGEILYDINENFITAWNRITPMEMEFVERRKAIKETAFKPKGAMEAQFCRTQPQILLANNQYERSILAIYKKAIENSHNYIYMENQYFRYLDIGKQVKKQAFSLKKGYKEFDVETNGLYLFVLTNNPNSDKLSSSTYEMMKELGQQQLMPEAQRTLLLEEEKKAFEKANPHYATGRPFWTNTPDPIGVDVISQKDQERVAPIKYNKEEIAKMSQQGEGWDIEGKEGKKPFELEDEAMAKLGLRVIIGTLTTDSSVTNPNPHFTQGNPRGVETYHSRSTRYRDIYIHTKLLVVDDLFTFLGSANINARSFWGDSESGIAIPNPDMAFSLRDELWQLHAKKSVNNATKNASKAIRCDSKENYSWWNKKMTNNWKNKAAGKPLECHITRFWDVETAYAKAYD
ncbi:hypothetical protein DKL61_15160 [Gammaproteobacteria bacterium ESL0073]|nr:hypothetical protein DKL61_15160 [Gammaproteobacteria bacterium ESL0073]